MDEREKDTEKVESYKQRETDKEREGGFENGEIKRGKEACRK